MLCRQQGIGAGGRGPLRCEDRRERQASRARLGARARVGPLLFDVLDDLGERPIAEGAERQSSCFRDPLLPEIEVLADLVDAFLLSVAVAQLIDELSLQLLELVSLGVAGPIL